MIKLTNAQVAAFQSPIMAKLFTDETRQFPIEDAFRISDFMGGLAVHQTAYNDTLRSTIEKHEGKIDPTTGAITYPSPANQDAATKEVEKLNSVVVECAGDKIKPNEDWPKLNLAEASILKPITKGT